MPKPRPLDQVQPVERVMLAMATHVVVVDDSARFVWHVYQYLSRRLGMRIQKVPRRGAAAIDAFFEDSAEEPGSPPKPKSVETDDGAFHVWWVPTFVPDWENRLDGVLHEVARRVGEVDCAPLAERMRGEGGDPLLRTSVLLDVTTPAGVVRPDRSGEGPPGYTVDRARGVCKAALEPILERCEVIPVSSYTAAANFSELGGLEELGGRWPRDVTPKTSEVLKDIRIRGRKIVSCAAAMQFELRGLDLGESGGPEPREDALPEAVEGARSTSPRSAFEQLDECHLLVTGAGFEMRGSQPKDRPDQSTHAGVRPTSALLKEAVELTLRRVAHLVGAEVSDSGIAELHAQFRGPDEERGIDEDVDALLTRLHGAAQGLTIAQNIQQRQRLDQALARLGHEALESSPFLDELYRRSIEGAGQPDAVSDLRFSLEMEFRRSFREVLLRDDFGHMIQSVLAARLPWASWLSTNYTRYADRAIDASRPFPEAPRWNVLSTPHEARSLMEKSPGMRPSRGFSDPILFKLHGDISHVNTMAIAGADKRLISPHAIRVDSISQLYNAAEMHLRRLVDQAEPVHLVWHVLGHGMNDSMLLDRMVRVTIEQLARNPASQATFVVVNGKLRGESSSSERAAKRIFRAVHARSGFYPKTLGSLLGKHVDEHESLDSPQLDEKRVRFRPLDWSATEYVERIWLSSESSLGPRPGGAAPATSSKAAGQKSRTHRGSAFHDASRIFSLTRAICQPRHCPDEQPPRQEAGGSTARR